MLRRARRQPSRPCLSSARRAMAVLGLCLAGGAGSASAQITHAEYAEPTTRYAHGVLGDTVEYGALRIQTAGGGTVVHRLDQNLVFEDLQPLLTDVDQDGFHEVIVIESSQTQGARLVIYSDTGRIAATPFIGTRFRWLAPLGAADLDQDGHMEIAYIDRPHLAKTLRIWGFRDGALTEIATAQGLTNHRIGEDFISGGIRDCGTGPEIITADATWSRLIASRLQNGEIVSHDLGPYSRASEAKALTCL